MDEQREVKRIAIGARNSVLDMTWRNSHRTPIPDLFVLSGSGEQLLLPTSYRSSANGPGNLIDITEEPGAWMKVAAHSSGTQAQHSFINGTISSFDNVVASTTGQDVALVKITSHHPNNGVSCLLSPSAVCSTDS